ncbi:hypothetical protein EEL30_21385 [Brevibacillus laterosporus]|uniref:Uncharacterized protein n=1 Tax=Brevibacillus laterosporus TaxID=1465 RepID=A0A518VC85_BRELA|nr:hypothetical protein EEL30_21385 [Brevibacillus laterosporus]
MTLTEIHSEYKKLNKLIDTYRGKKFLLDGSVIGLHGEIQCKVECIDMAEDSVGLVFYSPEEGYDEKDQWAVEWITISTLERHAKWLE